MSDIDFDELEQDSQLSSVSDKHYENLSEAVEKLAILRARKAKGETYMKEIDAEMADLQRRVLPAMMEAARTKDFTSLDTATKVEMKTIIKATMPKEKDDDDHDEPYEVRKKKAIGWLERNNLDDIVAREISVTLGKDSTELAQRLLDAIRLASNGAVEPELKDSVNYMTLNAVLKRRLESDQEVPTSEDGFDVFTGRIVDVVSATKRKRT
jgi:hypothetical protein